MSGLSRQWRRRAALAVAAAALAAAARRVAALCVVLEVAVFVVALASAGSAFSAIWM